MQTKEKTGKSEISVCVTWLHFLRISHRHSTTVKFFSDVALKTEQTLTSINHPGFSVQTGIQQQPWLHVAMPNTQQLWGLFWCSIKNGCDQPAGTKRCPLRCQQGVSSMFITSPMPLLCKSQRFRYEMEQNNKAMSLLPQFRMAFLYLFWGPGHCLWMPLNSRAADYTTSTLTWTFKQFLHSFWVSFSAEVRNTACLLNSALNGAGSGSITQLRPPEKVIFNGMLLVSPL